jgi:hypothetical protein
MLESVNQTGTASIATDQHGRKGVSRMAKQNRFTDLWKDMKKAVEAQDRDGWASPQTEQATKMLLHALWIVAHNPEHPVLLQMLEKYAGELARVKAEPPEPAGPNGTAD